MRWIIKEHSCGPATTTQVFDFHHLEVRFRPIERVQEAMRFLDTLSWSCLKHGVCPEVKVGDAEVSQDEVDPVRAMGVLSTQVMIQWQVQPAV